MGPNTTTNFVLTCGASSGDLASSVSGCTDPTTTRLRLRCCNKLQCGACMHTCVLRMQLDWMEAECRCNPARPLFSMHCIAAYGCCWVDRRPIAAGCDDIMF
eukprot:GHUV01046273.1.p1 GENE.GHUV01046273.1~~GHUV01046273.1.p1  ORF type:complete len:102 (+),score=1.19 GHUV01046273.1:671-976(+)